MFFFKEKNVPGAGTKKGSKSVNSNPNPNIVNSYAHKNPSLFGTGLKSSKANSIQSQTVDSLNTKTKAISIGAMFSRLENANKGGCRSCGSR